MVIYNAHLFYQLLQHLSTLASTNVTFYDENFTSTDICPPYNANQFCSCLKKTLQNHCISSDTHALMRAKEENDCFFYSCHFGLIEVALKLHLNNSIFGYLIIGPFRDPDHKTEDLERIAKHCAFYKEDEKKLTANYQKLQKFSLEKFNALKTISYALFEYAQRQNIIALRNNIFEEQIVPYIQNNLAEKLTIEDLCQKFFLSQKQLSQIVKNACNLSPKQYITQYRMLHAKNLIVSTNMPLEKIAETVGIPDYNYFVKVFKSVNRHTPTYYRKKT